MKTPNYSVLKNVMIVANGLSNIFALAVITLIVYPRDLQLRLYVYHPFVYYDVGFTIFAFMSIGLLVFVMEIPIRRYLDSLARHESLPPREVYQAQKRLLNYPFIIMGLDLVIWIFAAVFYSVVSVVMDLSLIMYQHIIVGCAATGLITSVMSFFTVEQIARRRLAPLFFPDGGLFKIKGALKIRLRMRIAMLLAACNIAPFGTILMIMLIAPTGFAPPEAVLRGLTHAVAICSIIFISLGAVLVHLTGLNLARPFEEITEVLDGIGRGKFNRRIRVVSNDEIGYVGHRINEMSQELWEREKMRQSMALAMEVQKNLLPRKAPEIPGIDLAGRSIYCDETGGDYFDFLELNGKVGLVVGDVSGHGISSALLMATARGFLRQRADMGGGLDEKAADVNRRLARDVEESGQFMTMFYAELDPGDLSISWVSAGHDPAVVYDPLNNEFSELDGGGPALALMADYPYEQHSRTLSPGQVVVIGTDGVWETHNSAGALFGKDALKTVIRENSRLSAEGILEKIIDEIFRFAGNKDQEDDVTLLVFKVMAITSTSL